MIDAFLCSPSKIRGLCAKLHRHQSCCISKCWPWHERGRRPFGCCMKSQILLFDMFHLVCTVDCQCQAMKFDREAMSISHNSIRLLSISTSSIFCY